MNSSNIFSQTESNIRNNSPSVPGMSLKSTLVFLPGLLFHFFLNKINCQQFQHFQQVRIKYKKKFPISSWHVPKVYPKLALLLSQLPAMHSFYRMPSLSSAWALATEPDLYPLSLSLSDLPSQYILIYTLSPYLQDYLPRHGSWHPPFAHKFQHQKKHVASSKGGLLRPAHLLVSPIALPVTSVWPHLALTTSCRWARRTPDDHCPAVPDPYNNHSPNIKSKDGQ